VGRTWDSGWGGEGDEEDKDDAKGVKRVKEERSERKGEKYKTALEGGGRKKKDGEVEEDRESTRRNG
jgi:hypothetical protein